MDFLPGMVIPTADPHPYGTGIPLGEKEDYTFLEGDAFRGVSIWGPPSGTKRRTSLPVEIPRVQDIEGK